MCGITGFLDTEGALSETDLRRMNATLRRRGPDGEGYFYEKGVGLAMRRLAIIDIAGGWQPVHNEDRSVTVVFNGEIYNYRQLRNELEKAGHTFRTQSDTEVIAHLYEEYGDRFTTKLEGMFAIALWDSRQQRLVLARDRLGIKPLYIAKVGSGIVFGSELKALLASNKVSQTIDWDAVDQYFAYTFIPAPRSIYSSVRKLLPAHQLVIERGGAIEERRYWCLTPHAPASMTMGEFEERTEQALLMAVESHMVSDVPVGAFLSGGIDSSVVTAMMTRFSDKPIQTFTVGFAAAGRTFIDERPYAREVARQYGLNHTEIEVNPDAAAILPEIVEAFDEPFADDSVIPTYYISQATSRSVKVALTGLGGDELFGGYKRHFALRLSGYYDALPSLFRKGVIEPLVRRIPESTAWGDAVDHVKRFARARHGGPAERYQDYLATRPWNDRRQLYHHDVAARIDSVCTEQVALDHFRRAESRDSLEQALRTDLGLYLPDDVLTLTDRVSMWHSLELRVPFLDHRLVELAANLPTYAKISGTKQKRILRSIAARWVPRSILSHRKQGFEAPMGAWLRGPLLPLFDELTTPRALAGLGAFDDGVVRQLRDEHIHGVRKNSKILFSLLVFMQWARQNRIDLGA
jgi:asparagine synthase (glutamine-hydrolysing)